jgi:hypothetical protein
MLHLLLWVYGERSVRKKLLLVRSSDAKANSNRRNQAWQRLGGEA